MDRNATFTKVVTLLRNEGNVSYAKLTQVCGPDLPEVISTLAKLGYCLRVGTRVFKIIG